ncbi:MAG: rRNA maturation RNase YbeY [Candidatus Moranbacteria bacterium]|nr:rRNA maturation RNase YbeY [Candidatus Moranbacteria bacterium]
MRVNIEINNLTRRKIDPELVKKVVRKTVKLSGADAASFELSVVFAGEAEMRKIYREYKGKNKSTDVLSFQLDLGYNKKSRKNLSKNISGEIILCPAVIAKNARENEVSFSSELAFVLSHGTLHVLGWNHSRKMYELQDEAMMQIHE